MATKKTLEAEALQENITFEFDGDVYTVPPADEWDIDIIEAQENGKLVTAVRLLIGNEQYGNFRKKHRKMVQFEKFLTALYDAIETDPKD